jgi:hypothetical protein
MTTVAVLADPPDHDTVFPGPVANGVLSGDEAADLYAALLGDACRAVEASGGDLLVNYRSPDDVTDEEARERVASAVTPALAAPDAARYEVQVGSSRSARVGNTVTHLLEREGVRSAAVLDPRVALCERRHVDSAAMKLRQSEVVLGPAYGGRVWYAAFTEPVDFTDAFDGPPLGTLTRRGRAAEFDVDFVETLPLVESERDLASAVAQVRARVHAGKPVGPETADAVAALGLDTDEAGDLVVGADAATDSS